MSSTHWVDRGKLVSAWWPAAYSVEGGYRPVRRRWIWTPDGWDWDDAEIEGARTYATEVEAICHAGDPS